MFTCCPHCKTCFRITKAQLAVAQGRVRCGTCSQIFNAREHLHETLPTRQPTDSRPPPAKRPAAPTTPSARPSPSPSPAAEPRRTAAPSSGPDLDLFAPPASPPQPPVDEEDIFADADAETEDTAVIDMGDDWDVLNEAAPSEEAEAPLPSEFHAPVQEAVSPPGDSDEMDIDLFEDDEPEAGEDTAVIDLTHAPDPFAPHAGVPVNRQTSAQVEEDADEEEDEEDDFLFDDEAEDTAVIDMRGESERLAGLNPVEESDGDAGAKAIPPLSFPTEAGQQDDATRDAGLFAPESLFNPPPTPAVDTEPAAEAAPDEDTAEVEPAPITVADSAHYAYVDPEDLQPEEKNIDEIIAEMNAQLSEDTEVRLPGEATATPPLEERARPAGDDFESQFLAELDDTLSQPLPEPPADDAPPPKRPESVKPAQVLDLIDPASQLNEGMLPEEEEVPLPLREHLVSERPVHHPLRFGLQILAVLLLTATLALQLAVFRSTEIANAVPALQPLLELICSRLPCQYHGPVAVDRIQLASRDIRDHPREPGALLIQATLVNRAPFAQPFPDMEITLSDLAGAVVARRRFRPREYLGNYWHPFLLMRPGQPVRVTLEVLNPGQDAVNFEFRFLPSARAQTVRP